jgi:hypothetical protein
VVGCSSGSSDDKATAPTTSTVAPQSAPSTTTPSPDPTPTTYAFGQSWHWEGNEGATGTTTALGYKQPVLQNDPPDGSLGVPAGSQWGRLDIKVCETTGPSIGVGQDAWYLVFADGSRADVTGLNGGDFPKPEFPQDGTVAAGDCARGGIMFPIPKGTRPVWVEYAPESAPEPVRWTIPSK